MLDKYTINAPAKINLFLKILSKNFNNYHLINTGITFLNLSNKIEVSISKENELNYTGPFKPLKKNFDNDIIFKVLKFLDLKQKIKSTYKKQQAKTKGVDLSRIWHDPLHFITCGFGLGLLPAPGTWGTLLGVVLYLIILIKCKYYSESLSFAFFKPSIIFFLS